MSVTIKNNHAHLSRTPISRLSSLCGFVVRADQVLVLIVWWLFLDLHHRGFDISCDSNQQAPRQQVNDIEQDERY
jgi:hypothetical protein